MGARQTAGNAQPTRAVRGSDAQRSARQRRPGNADPDNAQPDNADPDNAQPDNAQPDNAQPDNAQPDNADPAALALQRRPCNVQPGTQQVSRDSRKPRGKAPSLMLDGSWSGASAALSHRAMRCTSCTRCTQCTPHRLGLAVAGRGQEASDRVVMSPARSVERSVCVSIFWLIPAIRVRRTRCTCGGPGGGQLPQRTPRFV
ncbi:hypothetical protein Kisp01_32930 [Kineosporia sp. NBRC 101677]|nr:hypothetical protein Kisp01_32930 [Kineosporia sp. NBRC 101677]